MKTDLKKYGLVFSMVATAGLGLTACDTPEPAGSDDGEVSLRSASVPGLPQHVRGLLAANKITPIAPPPSVSPAMFALGEALFYDKILSGTRDVACATCHAPQHASADGRALNAGIDGVGVGRLAPA